MNKLYIKIHDYQEESGSLVVSFASDTTASQNPADYTPLAFQPSQMWPDIDDVDELKKRIAQIGIFHAEQQERNEKLKENKNREAALKALVGFEHVYDTSSLTAPVTPIE